MSHRLNSTASVVLLLISTFVHSGGATTTQAPPLTQTGVSLEFDLQPLLDSNCVQCHFLESAQGGLVLENGEAWSNLVDITSRQTTMNRVTPLKPQQSYLVHKLRGTHIEAGGSGLPMPYSSEANIGLSMETIDMVERWILQGADNN